MNPIIKDTQTSMDLESIRKEMPEDPGVYLFKDNNGRVIYVGKAKNIKKRVLSYFKPFSELSPKTAHMMKKAKDLGYIITKTENEAFILESTLIKKHMPRYNIILRDDKQYPCLRFSIKEPYPRLSIVRRMKKDGALYFGPFSSALSVRSTLKFIDKIFQLRKCKSAGVPKRTRPCLNGQLGRCLGPCTHDIPMNEYGLIVQHVKLFLEGRNPTLIGQLKKDMETASIRLQFEEAARIRDMIKAIENTIERQRVVSSRLEDQDVIGLVHQDGIFQLMILFIRGGYLQGKRDYLFREKDNEPFDVMEAFLKQYYSHESFIPKEILISEPIRDTDSIKDWLSDLAGKRVAIYLPQRGEKLRILQLAISNAQDCLARNIQAQKHDLMEQTKSTLNLKKIPRIIEGLDISNLQGDLPVGAVVSFVEGLPYKSGYRGYKIKKIDYIDDYGMMSELVARRLSRGQPPDLILVDGGKGHLLAAQRAMKDFKGPDKPDLVAIAKARKEKSETMDKIFLPGRKNPLPLKQDHPVLLLLMRIRDEAHRRAIGHHRRLRAKKIGISRLDHIPGIGGKRKKILLKRFGSMEGVLNASIEELTSIPGIHPSLAQRISEFKEER
ncbi:MAG: excinuclease ABC subunit UvrC [Deltaproteobacteria bacterium]|nr:excinuclease ABC subunit UvrC [Deltaproteobacteria bacterium]